MLFHSVPHISRTPVGVRIPSRELHLHDLDVDGQDERVCPHVTPGVVVDVVGTTEDPLAGLEVLPATAVVVSLARVPTDASSPGFIRLVPRETCPRSVYLYKISLRTYSVRTRGGSGYCIDCESVNVSKVCIMDKIGVLLGRSTLPSRFGGNVYPFVSNFLQSHSYL